MANIQFVYLYKGDTGWEIFSLDYAVEAPLTAVVHTEAIAKYRTAFHMLWRLRRVEWTLSGSYPSPRLNIHTYILSVSRTFFSINLLLYLSASWKQLMSFNHTKGPVVLPKLRPILHRCTLYRAKMMHVVTNLCGFLMFEVVEGAWSTLQSKIASARCLDDIISAHDNYLR